MTKELVTKKNILFGIKYNTPSLPGEAKQHQKFHIIQYKTHSHAEQDGL